MAAVDKIYGTLSQWEEVVSLLTNDYMNDPYCAHSREQLDRYLYPKPDEGKCGAICNLPVSIEVWLYNNCKTQWIIDDISERYNGPPHIG